MPNAAQLEDAKPAWNGFKRWLADARWGAAWQEFPDI